MHAVKRTRQTTEEREARKRREQSKIEEFTNLSERVLSRKKARDWSHDAFDLTTRLLQVNPEFYTIWNYRRNIFINGFFVNSLPEDIKNVLTDDLAMTMSALKAHPKLGSHAKPESAELAYTSRKIEANFSNFSAWHQRSKTLTSLWEQGKLDESKSREEEFELLRNAMYTDPNDQSVWMYHRWLVGTDGSTELLEREIAAIQELLDEQPDSTWCMESIVHYKLLLLKKSSSDSQRSLLSKECGLLLKRLQDLDSARRRRYQDLGLSL
ncbi:hypothetical protein BDZ97DRAFT_1754314 [Flammula alnicola]|nr:hypothetical protein BDZ97DRAFT_1754314 [Flammula alnicola]